MRFHQKLNKSPTFAERALSLPPGRGSTDQDSEVWDPGSRTAQCGGAGSPGGRAKEARGQERAQASMQVCVHACLGVHQCVSECECEQQVSAGV